jgi:hypothetical protein
MAIKRDVAVTRAFDATDRARRQVALFTDGGRYDRPREHTPHPLGCWACIVEAHVARMREIIAAAER